MTVDVSPSRSLPAKSQDLFSAETAFVEVRKSGPTLVAKSANEHKGGDRDSNLPVIGGREQTKLWSSEATVRAISWDGAEGETEAVKMSGLSNCLLL